MQIVSTSIASLSTFIVRSQIEGVSNFLGEGNLGSNGSPLINVRLLLKFASWQAMKRRKQQNRPHKVSAVNTPAEGILAKELHVVLVINGGDKEEDENEFKRQF